MRILQGKNLMAFGLSIIVLLLAGFASTGFSEEPVLHSIYDVKDYGAVGDGETDDTAAIQSALNEAGAARGGIVFLPTGNYLIKTHLNIPSYVTLEGVWNSPTAWSAYNGTTLLAVEGEGDPDGTPFILLQQDATLKGVAIFYPNQKPDDVKPYPWCIAGIRDNPTIIDVMLVNPYQGVDFGTYRHPAGGVGRFLIRNLYGQPLRKGIWVNGCLDVGRIENVHFWPFWQGAGYTREHGEAFIFGRTDWQYVLNTFCWGYKIGYKFVNEGQGVCNGNFVGIGADFTEYAVYAEATSDLGVLITNGEFVSFGGPDSTEIVTPPEFNGRLLFQNCAFWGPAKNIARLQGTGTTSFQSCNFRHWGYIDPPQPAIDCLGGSLIVTGSQFSEACMKVHLAEKVEKAIFTNNMGAGVAGVLNESTGRVLLEPNLFDGFPKEEDDAIIVDNSMTKGSSPVGFFECSEGWGKEGSDGAYMGESFHAKAGDGEMRARWTPVLKRSGNYEISVWLPPKQVYVVSNAAPATNASYRVTHREGETDVTVDYSSDFVGWHSLGVYKLSKGDSQSVQVTDAADGFVPADSVKFVRK